MKIKIFVRHCNISANSINKPRPNWYSREKCWNNLCNTIDQDTTVTVLFDGFPDESHFLYGTDADIICMPAGNDAKSFMNLLEYVKGLNLPDDTIIYFLEDDFYHRPGWTNILREGFQYIGVDYITLYDHSDKYNQTMYGDLQSKILVTPSTHWRTTPSTTNTYAMLSETLNKHYNIHTEYCDLSRGITKDHDKFTRLWKEGSNLISCIPGYSTHCENEWLSPIIKWDEI